MVLSEREFTIPRMERGKRHLLAYLSKAVMERLGPGELPVRFVVTRTDAQAYYCELGVLSEREFLWGARSIFQFQKRSFENTGKFTAVLLVPTGVGAVLGGHAGDAGPLARLFAGACDTLITHPNVVNASDINELPENGLYVEGSTIAQLMMGAIGLAPVRSNRVMLIVDKPEDKYFLEAAINAASAARASMGVSCPLVVKMGEGRAITMKALYAVSGRATGRIEQFECLEDILQRYRGAYDAVALSTIIDVPRELHKGYYMKEEREEMINPWGGVEALLTHTVSLLYDVPSAHSPMMSTGNVMDFEAGVVDPRKAAEYVSVAYLHCILKGLHNSPRIVHNVSLTQPYTHMITAADVSCLVIPDRCVGLPTLAALEQGIPVIAVRENENHMQNDLNEFAATAGNLFIVDNYLEAVGVMQALKSGVSLESVRRPLADTHVREAVPAASTVVSYIAPKFPLMEVK